MSVSSIIASNQKIFDSLLPNPYPYPAQPPSLAQVLTVGDDAGNGNIENLDLLQTTNVVQQDTLGQQFLVIGGTIATPGVGGDLRIQGATTKGSLLVGNGTSSVEIPVGVNGLVLKANSATATGVEWGVDGTGGITGVSAGTNISIDNTNPLIPIVNFATPTTSNIEIGVGTEILATSGFTTMSIDSTGLNDKYLNGGVVNQEDIAVDATSVIETISTTDASTYQHSIITTCNNTNTTTAYQASNPFIPNPTSGFTTINCDINGSSVNVGCNVDGFPATENGTASLQASSTDPKLTLSQTGTLATSYSTTFDKNGITQNNSSGAGFTLSVLNGENCSITSTANSSITGGVGGSSSINCGTGAVIVSADQIISVSGLAGAVATPNFTLRNQNVAPTSYPSLKLDKSGVVAPAAGTISAISSWAVDAAGTSREWSRIQTIATNVASPSNQDGTISIFGSVNGTMAEVFNFNGSQNENNCFKPLDMNSNDIRSNTGDLTLTATASIGTGNAILQSKSTGSVVLDSPVLTLKNTNTTNSTPIGNTIAIETTSPMSNITTFLKLKLGLVDIWVPYLTFDPSL